jgi:stress-induced morphogen
MPILIRLAHYSCSSMLPRIFSSGIKRLTSPSSRPRVTAKRRRFLAAMAAEALGPKAQSIQQKLSEVFSPTQLEIVNESFKHNVPKGSETHFKVRNTVSQFFPTVPPVKVY